MDNIFQYKIRTHLLSFVLGIPACYLAILVFFYEQTLNLILQIAFLVFD